MNNSCKVLVVDDDELLNMLCSEYLQDEGFIVASAFGVQDALSHLDKTIDFVLLDYNLGDGDGLEFMKRAASLGMTPPIIMASTNEDPDFLKKCFDSGVSDYIVKPVNVPLLILKIKSLIEQARLQRLIEQKNSELSDYKIKSEQEESVAKFIYGHLVNGVDETFDGVSFFLQSSSAFSGDIGFGLRSPSGDLYILFADATGHGLSAAITLMPVVSIFKSMVAKGFSLPMIVMEINRKLVTDTPDDRFVAAVVIQVDRMRSEISIWNGAMPSVYWVDGAAIRREFKSSHMALGILPDELFDPSVETMVLPSSGYIFSCSDGLLEQENPLGKEFGKERLINYLCADKVGDPQVLCSALQLHAQTQSYEDDVSYLYIDPLKLSEHSFCSLDDKHRCMTHSTSENFRWSLRVCGENLKKVDLGSFNNRLLQTFGLQQDFCQRAFVVLSEMINNAIDHGVLGLNSSIKDSPDGFARYFLLREKKLSTLSSSDHLDIIIEWCVNEAIPRLLIEVTDSGVGYQENNSLLESNAAFSGRGLALVRSLCKSVTVVAPGNKIKVELECQ
jgi:CheY-like chemotaxis protein